MIHLLLFLVTIQRRKEILMNENIAKLKKEMKSKSGARKTSSTTQQICEDI